MRSDHSWIRLKEANGFESPYFGFIEADAYVPVLDKSIEGRDILIVKDCPGKGGVIDRRFLMGMNIISQCMEIFESYLPNKGDHRKSKIRGFAREAGRSEFCVPANSVSVVNVVGPTQNSDSDFEKIVNI